MKKFVILCLALTLWTLPLFSQSENENKVVKNDAPAPAGPTPEQRQKVMMIMEDGRAKFEKLVKERTELVAKNASPAEVQAKTNEMEELKKTTLQTLRKIDPSIYFGPPQGRDVSTLPIEKQAELKLLIEKRRQMVDGGAGHREVAEITKKISDIYSSEPKPAVGANPQASTAGNSQNSGK